MGNHSIPSSRAIVGRSQRRLALAGALVAGAAYTAACTGGHLAAMPDTSLAAEVVRAMSFNVRYGTAPDGEHAWPLRRELTFRVIREFAPTVLGVQEALRFQLDETGSVLPDHGMVGVGREDGVERGEYSAIFYDRRRLELLEHDTFWLSDMPAVPGSMSWGNRITRIATWARFRDRATHATFYVFNTHWDHESQPSRERSAALIIERIGARAHPDDPVLLMGDFNAGEDNAAFQALLAPRAAVPGNVPLYDTFRAVHPAARETGTLNAFRGDRSGPKIDAILASPEWQTLDAAIVLLEENGRYPSDHFPVIAVLRLPASNR
ncbi:MAG: endonuclease/exonuclease/phosphatase family protein [Gemmatimonadetes bacterium]|nr:endonuclease/exonuclease/phosphatase family protein [Gemmatimonadota bacterium]